MKAEDNKDWIALTTGKQFSRLLYTNPVCFLSTSSAGGNGPSPNVMVLSWLTATNNEGRFMFSLNKRRHTASLFVKDDIEFCLSVPVQGMEDMVRGVGGTSGRHGSKFQQNHQSDEMESEGQNNVAVSRRQQKKSRVSAQGVLGLKSVSFGNTLAIGNDTELSAIEGTAAHLKCKAYRIIKEPIIDNDHYLVLAEVQAAYVLKSYWNDKKSLFQPQHIDTPPYLTFLGSQTFGYVHTK